MSCYQLCPLIRTRCRKEETTTWAQCERSVTLTRALRARAAGPQSGLFSCVAAARAACVISTWLGEREANNMLDYAKVISARRATTPAKLHSIIILNFYCRGDTRPARGLKLTLLSQRGFARTVDGYHPSRIFTVQYTLNNTCASPVFYYARISPNQVLTHAARAKGSG